MEECLITVSCITAFSNPKRDLTDLRATLTALRQQTYPLHEIIVCDDAPEEDKAGIAALCAEFGAEYMPYPFTNWALATGGQYNQAVARSTGDVILLLCPHWVLAPNWVREMVEWLAELGPGNVIATDNDRHALIRTEGGRPLNWFAHKPVRFETFDAGDMDHAKTMCWRRDWVDFDTRLDCPPGDTTAEKGNCHGFILWAWEHAVLHGRHLWLRRDLRMEHAPSTHTPWLLEHSLQRHGWSYARLLEIMEEKKRARV